MAKTKLDIIGILGADHSCTTLLGCMLGSAENFGGVFHTGECHAYFQGTGPRWLRFFTQGRVYRPDCVVEKNCAIWSRIPREGGKNAWHAIAQVQNCRVIIDSSKTPAWFARQQKHAHREGWGLQYILCWRPVMDLAQSYCRRVHPVAAYEMTRQQLKRLDECLAFAEKSGRSLIVVNGNDLVARPAAMLEKICSLTDIPYFAGKENYWNFQHHHLYGGATQKKHLLNPAQASFRPSPSAPHFRSAEFEKLERQWAQTVRILQERSLKA